MYYFILGVAILFSLSGCENCATEKICTDGFSFRIVSKSTNEDLVLSSNPTYNKDSVYLLTSRPGYSGNCSYLDGNSFKLTLTFPVDSFFLQLNSADTDTLYVSYDFNRETCCTLVGGYGRVLNINHNGVPSKKTGGIYLIEK